ncbi:MAG: hypothetical protein GY944_04965 [bacterium]|nr:hypothetical protein [bacterium]
MWAVTDFSEDHEEARLVRDNHAWDRSPDPRGTREGIEGISAVLKRDSVTVRGGSLRHGGGTHHTSEPPIATNSCTSFISQQKNRQLCIPCEMARDFSLCLERLAEDGDPRGVRDR